jgi:hypothetical protein
VVDGLHLEQRLYCLRQGQRLGYLCQPRWMHLQPRLLRHPQLRLQ